MRIRRWKVPSRCLMLALAVSVTLMAGCSGKPKGAVPTPGAPPAAAPASPGGSQAGSGAAPGAASPAAGAGGAGAMPAGQPSPTTPGTGAAGAAGGAAGAAADKAAAPTPAPAPLVKLGPLQARAEGAIGPISVKLGSMEGRQAGMTFPGYDFFLIQVTVKNTGTRPFQINTLNQFDLVEPDGKSQKINVQAMSARPERIDGDLKPGETKTGWLGFMVKLADGKYRLFFKLPDYGEASWEFEAPPL